MALHTTPDQSILFAVGLGGRVAVLGVIGKAVTWELEQGYFEEIIEGRSEPPASVPEDPGLYLWEGVHQYEDGWGSGELGGRGEPDSWIEGEWRPVTLADFSRFGLVAPGARVPESVTS